MLLKTKLAAGAGATILTLALTGAAALAAFQPVEPVAPSTVHADASTQAASERGEKGGKGLEALEAVLARLVTSGSITAAQRDTILEAMRTAGEKRGDQRHGELKRIWASLMRLAVEHLGVTKAEVREALGAGRSLGELADETDGKSRDDLIGFLVAEATALIDEALADGKITPEQADEATAQLEERVTKFVDHVYTGRPGVGAGKERFRDLQERYKEQFKDLKERFQEELKDLKERLKERRQRSSDED